MSRVLPILAVLFSFSGLVNAQVPLQAQVTQPVPVMAVSQEWAVLPEQLTPDNRYASYTGRAIVWPTMGPDGGSCGTGYYYTPSYLSLRAKKKNVAFTRPLESDACVWMFTVRGWQWVLQPAGTMFDFDSLGRPLYRHDCGNPTPVISYPRVPMVQPVPVQPAPPPPQAVCEVIVPQRATLLGTEQQTFSARVNNPANLPLEYKWFTERIGPAGTTLDGKDYLLETGPSVTIDGARYGLGAHRIGVEVIDSEGRMSVCTAQFSIEALPPPPAQPPPAFVPPPPPPDRGIGLVPKILIGVGVAALVGGIIYALTRDDDKDKFRDVPKPPVLVISPAAAPQPVRAVSLRYSW